MKRPQKRNHVPSFIKTLQSFPSLFFWSFLSLTYVGNTLLSVAIANGEQQKAQSEIVRVNIQGELLEPSKVSIAPGSTILWVNNAGNPVRVKFLSKPISTLCASPMGFEYSTQGVRASENIRRGDVMSLCILESKKYNYEVEVLEQSDVSSTSKQFPVLRRLQGIVDVN